MRGCTSSGTPGPSSFTSRTTASPSRSCQVRRIERAASVGREHRLLGVDDQVEQDLLELVRIGEGERQAGRQRLDDADVRQRLLVRSQRERFAHDLVHVDHGARRVALAREGQQVADDLGGALGLAEDRLEAAPGLIVDGPLRQPLGPREDRGERIVQLVRDAGDRLAERGELLGLQELVIEIARLVLEPLALADVAHQRLDVHAAFVPRLGVGGDLDPDGDAIRAAQAEEIVRHRAVALEPGDEPVARQRIDEAIRLERAHVRLGRVRREAEHQLEVGIRGHRPRVRPVNGADVHALVDRLEQPRERLDVRRQSVLDMAQS